MASSGRLLGRNQLGTKVTTRNNHEGSSHNHAHRPTLSENPFRGDRLVSDTLES